MANLLKFIVENFSHVFPVLLVGAIGVLIIFERSVDLFFVYPLQNSDSFFNRLRHSIMKDKIPEAIALCDRHQSNPAARVVRLGLMRAHQPETLITNGLQIAVSEASQKIQARTSYLATIANVATLFGLLGTIIGLVQSFEAVGAATAQQRSALLAQGISTAMNATILGLTVAIPCMIAYSILISRTNKIITQVDEAASRVLDMLQQRYFTVKPGASSPGENTFTDQVDI
ncbi:MAG: hypothetical protein A2Z20_00225 [Bdellovibrionales bacterium RBG_16_40_8]|nr:MAG: hypothetical protein A2Z20_00225 [Bdellovibrionales bacterium RBG_16_40_8]